MNTQKLSRILCESMKQQQKVAYFFFVGGGVMKKEQHITELRERKECTLKEITLINDIKTTLFFQKLL